MHTNHTYTIIFLLCTNEIISPFLNYGTQRCIRRSSPWDPCCSDWPSSTWQSLTSHLHLDLWHYILNSFKYAHKISAIKRCLYKNLYRSLSASLTTKHASLVIKVGIFPYLWKAIHLYSYYLVYEAVHTYIHIKFNLHMDVYWHKCNYKCTYTYARRYTYMCTQSIPHNLQDWILEGTITKICVSYMFMHE